MQTRGEARSGGREGREDAVSAWKLHGPTVVTLQKGKSGGDYFTPAWIILGIRSAASITLDGSARAGVGEGDRTGHGRGDRQFSSRRPSYRHEDPRAHDMGEQKRGQTTELRAK